MTKQLAYVHENVCKIWMCTYAENSKKKVSEIIEYT